MQIIGKYWDEGRILSVAHAFEAATGWRNRLPEIA
jgi:Asp-tRNA(Asn)/Glu-tRNA(Gln) amidotransferase A subunit family amidase